jgi:hypothetical protein
MPNRWDQSAVFLQSGDPEKENVASLSYPGQLGTRFTVIAKGPAASVYSAGMPTPAAGRAKTYQLVQTDSSAATAPFPNAVAWWSDKTKYLVTTSASKTGRGRVAGRFPDNGAGGSMGPGNYGCIQTYGTGFVRLINGPTATPDATGKFIVPSATDGLADCIAAGTASTYPVMGYSSGVFDAANVQVLVDLDVPNTP